MKGIIFSSDFDLPYAESCANHLETLGIAPLIIKGIPAGREQLGLRGSQVAREMLDAMISSTGDDNEVVFRIDVDTKLLPIGAEWLGGITHGEARGYMVGNSKVCVCSGGTRKHLLNIRPLLQTAIGEGCCSGCLINFALNQMKDGGGIMKRTRGLWRLNPDEETPPDAHLITMPPRELDSQRKAQMELMWGATE
jgi:hypothetical protein